MTDQSTSESTSLRGKSLTGLGKRADERMKRSANFIATCPVLPDGWTAASITRSDDRAIVAYVRAVSGNPIMTAADALTVINSQGAALRAETLRYRATRWWRDYGIVVHG